ncbi:DoxX-like family protein [Ekhidna lutea]|uniref:DoxX-like family protein n=1 Tax=Ekhidna lutea TaxID=447679 RepID=A0A239JXP7_EKHLU|nr:DoxX family protein [Ekhidna lutea]SNT10262.1 DoxX-like family protein [Ekhidna lutea]
MKNKILFILCMLSGLMFINAGLNKFFNYLPVPEDLPEEAMNMFMAMMEITWLMPLIATFEIVGGALFIIPRFRALGAIILTPIMFGIIAHHLTLGFGLPIPLVMAVILVWVIIENRDKYLSMITKNN